MNRVCQREGCNKKEAHVHLRDIMEATRRDPTPDAQAATRLAEEITDAVLAVGYAQTGGHTGALLYATRLLSAEAAGQRQYEENVEQIKKQAALEARVKELEAGLAQAKDALKQIAENLAPCCSYECVEIAEAVLRALDLPGEGKEKA